MSQATAVPIPRQNCGTPTERPEAADDTAPAARMLELHRKLEKTDRQWREFRTMSVSHSRVWGEVEPSVDRAVLFCLVPAGACLLALIYSLLFLEFTVFTVGLGVSFGVAILGFIVRYSIAKSFSRQEAEYQASRGAILAEIEALGQA